MSGSRRPTASVGGEAQDKNDSWESENGESDNPPPTLPPPRPVTSAWSLIADDAPSSSSAGGCGRDGPPNRSLMAPMVLARAWVAPSLCSEHPPPPFPAVVVVVFRIVEVVEYVLRIHANDFFE